MRILILGSLAVALVGGGLIYFLMSGSTVDTSSRAKELGWEDLRELDYKTGAINGSLAESDGAVVKIPGFMVPLQDNSKEVSKFLLVPNAQACIHVPPPPPNQMVMVEMREGRRVKSLYGPVWVEGVFRIADVESVYGRSGFQMKASSVKPYEW